MLYALTKRVVLHVCKWFGGFAVARQLTKRGLRILGYHGFILTDEGRFRPALFMDGELFRKRLEFITQKGYPVLTLDEAVERLRLNTLPNCATVITIDDGFYSAWKLAVPILKEFQLPGTLYVSTYYCLKGTPIFRLVIQYMFWKTHKRSIDLTDVGLDEEGEAPIFEPQARHNVSWRIISYGEKQLNECERVRLCEAIGARLEVDYAEIVKSRFLTLMSMDELRDASRAGVDIQLHTHRHVLPIEPESAKKEIAENRDVLEPLVGRTLSHFCYPSGIHYNEHLEPLAESGVTSATTCERGLNYSDGQLLTLNRLLDAGNISWIEFEAEMAGFTDLLRKIRRLV